MNPQTNHLSALTGMRFFAAMAVVVGHLTADHNGDGFGRFGLPHLSMVLGGAAVSFFFVLSGFILTYVYKDQLTYGGVKKFYYKRWARIWPLHLVCLIISIYVVSMTINNYAMLTVNLALLQSWVPNDQWVFSFNGVSWSISSEMFFYFMFPFFLIGGQHRFWLKYVLLWILVIGAVIGLQSLANNPDWASYNFDRSAHVNPFLRLPEFATGMGVGFLFFNRAKNRKKRAFAFDTVAEVMALSLIPIFSLASRHFNVRWVIRNAEWGGSVTALWVQYAGMVFVFAAIIYVFSRSHGFFARILGSRPFVFLGEISFAIYMIHFLVILGIDRFDWSASTQSPYVIGACATTISISLAAFLYKLVEMPAKSGLMSLYAGDFKKSILDFPKDTFRFLKSPTCWGYFLVLGLSIAMTKASYVPLNVDDQIQAVMAVSHRPYKDVNFGNLIRLMGAQATATPQGIELNLVWQKKGPLHRSRFIHFCDHDGNILSQLSPQQEIYENAQLTQPLMESVLLPNAKLADERITQIGIGFFSKEIDPQTDKQYPMLKVSKGARGFSNFRLHVISEQQLKKLRMQLAKFADDGSPK